MPFFSTCKTIFMAGGNAHAGNRAAGNNSNQNKTARTGNKARQRYNKRSIPPPTPGGAIGYCKKLNAAAKYLHISRNTLLRRHHAGLIAGSMPGNALEFDIVYLDDYNARCTKNNQ